MHKELNPHYDFDDPENRACIEQVEAYDTAFANGDAEFLQAAEKVALGGSSEYVVGVKVEDSPWGANEVLSVNHEDGVDIVKKDITVKPGFMLSLQRHRGRQELWEVESGTLTVISDGELHEKTAGNSIELPKGNVHCMVNMHDEPVRVIETQTGKCLEADNVRLVDCSGRSTYPLLTKTEAQSAILYAQIQTKIAAKFDHADEPSPALLEPAYANTVAKLESGVSS